MTFKAGDIVKLKTGSPRLIVLGETPGFNGPSEIICFWIDSEGMPHKEAIPRMALESD